MKKIPTVFMATALFALSAGAAVSPAFSGIKKYTVEVSPTYSTFNSDAAPLVLNRPQTAISIGAPLDFLSMTPKQFEEATGQKLNFIQKIKFNVVKKVVKKKTAAGSKSQTTAILLALFLGGLGIHRFYLGYTWQGVVQLLTLGGLGIWSLIDLVRIITGSLQPKDGTYE